MPATLPGSSWGFFSRLQYFSVPDCCGLAVPGDTHNFYQLITYCIIISLEMQAVWLSLQHGSSAGVNPLLFLTLWQLV